MQQVPTKRGGEQVACSGSRWLTKLNMSRDLGAQMNTYAHKDSMSTPKSREILLGNELHKICAKNALCRIARGKPRVVIRESARASPNNSVCRPTYRDLIGLRRFLMEPTFLLWHFSMEVISWLHWQCFAANRSTCAEFRLSYLTKPFFGYIRTTQQLRLLIDFLIQSKCSLRSPQSTL